MTDSVNDLTTKTGKMAIDEKYDTNWCHLPTEMKRACIEKMKFHTRYQLSCTANEEKEIVESLRYKFDSLIVREDRFRLWTEEPIEHYEVIKFGHRNKTFYDKFDQRIYDIPKMISIFTFALKTCNFDIIELENSVFMDQVDWENFNILLKPREVRIENVNDNPDFSSIIKFFRKCWNNVDSIDIVAPYQNFPFEELFTIPSVFTTRKLNIRAMHFFPISPRHFIPLFELFTTRLLMIDKSAFCKTSHYFIPLIEKWIENDAEIGTKLINAISCPKQQYPIDKLLARFKNRQISRQEFTIRIKTDNDGKHILMTFANLPWDRFYCVVIPSDIDESNYADFIEL